MSYLFPPLKLKKASLFTPLLFVLALNGYSQFTPRYELLLTTAYTNASLDYQPEGGTSEGNYGYGLAFRYRLGAAAKRFQIKTGLAYSNVSYKDFRKVERNLTRRDIRRFHYLNIPLYLTLDNNSWRGGVEIALETLLNESNQYTRYDEAGNVISSQKTTGTPAKVLVNFGLGFGGFIGKSIKINDDLMLLIEGQFKAFTVLPPLMHHDEFFLEDIHPYWVGLSVGVGF